MDEYQSCGSVLCILLINYSVTNFLADTVFSLHMALHRPDFGPLCIVCSQGLVTLAFASRLWYREMSLVYCVFSDLVTLAFASRLWCRGGVSCVLCVLWPCYTGFCQSTLVQGGVSCVLCVLWPCYTGFCQSTLVQGCVSCVLCVLWPCYTGFCQSTLVQGDVSCVLCVLWPCYTGFCQSTLVQGGVFLCIMCSLALLHWLLPVTGGGGGGGGVEEATRWGGAKIESMLPFDVALPVKTSIIITQCNQQSLAYNLE